MKDEPTAKQSLEDEVDLIVQEGRMVLPGIQALFGFQLVAVFNERFPRSLPLPAQCLHLAAVVLVALSIALIMAPAAYHRQVERDRVSQYFADYASLLITVALAPLLVAIGIEVSLVAYAILGSLGIPITLGAALACVYGGLWYLFPRWRRRRRSSGSARGVRWSGRRRAQH